MKHKCVNKNRTFHARIDKGWQQLLIRMCVRTGRPIKGLIEDALENTYAIDTDGELYAIDERKSGGKGRF